MKIHKNNHYSMMLIFSKNCVRPGEGRGMKIQTHADKGPGGWAKIRGHPLWMAPIVKEWEDMCIKTHSALKGMVHLF